MFMIQWWESLTLVQQIFSLVAIPATVILIVQTIMVLIGVGEVEGDLDFDTDSGGFLDGVESSNGLALFSVRGIVAFFAVGGWIGVVMDATGVHLAITLIVSVFAGTISLIGIGLLMRATLKLQDKGNIALKNAVGKTAKVYITVPATGKTGKVNLTLQGRYTECDALTKSGKEFRPGQMVEVTGMADSNTLIVDELVEMTKEEKTN